MTEAINPLIRPSKQVIGFKSRDERYQSQSPMTKLKQCTARQHKRINQGLQSTRILHEIRTFKGVNYDAFYKEEITSSTVDHISIRGRAKKRVIGLLLKDELIQVERDKKQQALLKSEEEEKGINMIKDKAKDFKKSNASQKYKQYAKQIMTARVKLNQSMKTKKINPRATNESNTICDNKIIDISQRNKMNLSSDLLRAKTSNIIKSECKEEIQVNDKGIPINNLSNDKNCLKEGQNKEEELPCSLKQRRMRDLTKFLTQLTSNPLK